MTTIGSQLSSARKELGLSVESVSFESKIRPSIIENLEADNYSQFSSASYVKSFIRKYSELLGLDLENEIQNLVLEEPEKKRQYQPQENVKESLESAEFSKKNVRYRKAQRSKGSPIFLVGSVLLLITGIVYFYHLGSQASQAEEGAEDLVEEFDSKDDAFIRTKAASDNSIRSKNTLNPIEAPVSTAKPMAATRRSVPADDQRTPIKPDNSADALSPLSDY